VSLPDFTENAELPPGVHRATLRETLERFGSGSSRRKVIASRLQRIYELAASTGQVARFVVFGSFVTAKAEPNDVDLFLLMEDAFDAGQVVGEARLLFDHAIAQAHFGASVFWLRPLTALGGEQETIDYWQIKREGGQRGIVEIIPEQP
jgi:predicted nucleotidyltransferase